MFSKEYWDTCLFITYLQNRPDEKDDVDVVDALIRGASQKNERLIIVSTLVLAEVRPKDIYEPFHWAVIRDLFYTNRPYIKVQVLTPRLADLASGIGGNLSNLSPADAVHIATAISEKVDVFYTFDGKHEHGKRRTTDILDYDGKIGSPPLKIKVPEMPLNAQLSLNRQS
jgi:predicted nucleic acid-binding protein